MILKSRGRPGVLAVLGLSCTVGLAQPPAHRRLPSCDPTLTALFTPPHPLLGRYEVCTSADPIDIVAAAENGQFGQAELLEPLDALGQAGPYDRAAVVKLYGGRRARVVRGWRRDGDDIVSITLLSPHPDPTLTELRAGTLVIHYVLSARDYNR